jgi:hypothetical protein
MATQLSPISLLAQSKSNVYNRKRVIVHIVLVHHIATIPRAFLLRYLVLLRTGQALSLYAVRR